MHFPSNFVVAITEKSLDVLLNLLKEREKINKGKVRSHLISVCVTMTPERARCVKQKVPSKNTID